MSAGRTRLARSPMRTASDSRSTRVMRRRSICCSSTSTTTFTPIQVIPLDPQVNKTFHFWHVYVKGVKAGHALRLPRRRPATTSHGQRPPLQPEQGADRPVRAAASPTTLWDRGAACGPDDNVATSMRSVDHRPDGLRLGGRPAAQPADERDDHLRDARPRLHPARRPSGVEHPGTFAGLVEKIPYLKWLGVTAVELLPVHEFDECECSCTNPIDRRAAAQLLGLQHGRFFAPQGRLLRQPRGGRPDPRVPRHGQGAPRGRHRGHPRRGLQPHRRGRRPRADVSLPRPRQQHLLLPGPTTGGTT